MSIYKDLFENTSPSVYTMPSHAPFLQNLAKGLITALGDDLPKALILLPTRRAVRALADEFVRAAKTRATLLPMMKPLADMDENEPPFTTGTIDFDIPPAIDPVRHRFELAKLVAAKMKHEGDERGTAPDAATALAMAEPLARLLADLAMEELGPDALSKLDDKLEDLAAHFQSAHTFVTIVAKHWPQFLADNNLSEPMTRRVALLNKAAQIWSSKPPAHPVIIAGSTGTLKAVAGLIKTVTALPQGLVILPGLDTHIDDSDAKFDIWDKIDDQHPQASLKNLLQTLELKRADIPVWPGVKTDNKAAMRSRILSHALIPASSTYDWPARIARIAKSTSNDSVQQAIKDGLSGLSLIEARTSEEEAGVIALIMRETLEHTDKICALVTPDPALARRGRAKLSRWHIEVDSSAGEPLEETGHGAFLALSLEAANDPFDPVALSALVKHPLFDLQAKRQRDWDKLEIRALRGTRPKSLDMVANRLDGHCAQGFALLQKLHTVLSPLHTMLSGETNVELLAKTHVELLEVLAGGAEKLWRGEAGEKSAALAEELLAYGSLLAPVSGETYLRLLSQLMRGRVARPRFGTEERLQILGPLEARMLEADTIILGSLNEGIWPAHPAPHPVLSPGMRKTIGLSAPERRFGLAAHDFEALAAKPNVILTRAARTEDGPAVQSRWLWRLTTLARGALGDAVDDVFKPEQTWLEWARLQDAAPDKPVPAQRPAPCPPLDKRWPKKRGLSVTRIKTWVRDPYAIYASQILRLHPLDPLGQPLGGREYGLAVHKAFEAIDTLDAGAFAKLLQDELLAAGYEAHSFARMNVRINEMANWAIDWARDRRDQGWKPAGIEKKGRLEFPPHNTQKDGEPFILTGIADRIECKGGETVIIDYKTGAIPGIAEVQVGFDPQMPLLGIMLGYGVLGERRDATDYLYIKPNDPTKNRRLCKAKDADEYASEAFENLQKLIAHFDTPDSRYYSQPRAKFQNQYGDYDHLARRAEWASLGEET